MRWIDSYEATSEIPEITNPEDVSNYVDADHLRSALDTLTPGARVAVAAAHIFDRKGEISSDNFGDRANASYRGNEDDILITVTYRLDSWEHKEQYAAFTALAQQATETKAYLAQEAAQRRLESLQRAAAEAQARADQAAADLAAAQAAVRGD